MSKSDNFFLNFSIKKWKKNPEKIIKGEILTDILFDDLHIFHLSYIANYFYINFDLVPKYFQIIMDCRINSCFCAIKAKGSSLELAPSKRI